MLASVDRIERSVGLNIQHQLVVVSALSNASSDDFVRYIQNRTVKRVDSDGSELELSLIRSSVVLYPRPGPIVISSSNEAAFIGQSRDYEILVYDFNIRVFEKSAAVTTFSPFTESESFTGSSENNFILSVFKFKIISKASSFI